ncbi:hypothetical protein DFA_03710 [Cavenderia fasciculata]|uniref:Cytochrome P450 family protein n=1 Tax=Cavenderia fasciculata TaxID=261658 RepID=F4Q1S3_CACFS|nr:uncharacterized protein DFA_03710 [Cavenderia fasciculata]EGG18223.1 hypothetical protein DFA_03710 [Cavenderia fasciculata]|eukprot:XP_004357046.1 hypothetical protein DFA_03710 [Cavenderia fasciculata]
MLILYVIAFLLLISFIQKNKKFSSKDPPGPLELPIIGSIYKINPKMPHLEMTRLSKVYGKVFKMWFGKNYTIIINDASIYREMYVDKAAMFGDRPNLPSLHLLVPGLRDISLENYDAWKPVREFTSTSLARSRSRTLNGILDYQTNQILNSLKQFSKIREPFSPSFYYQKYTINVILKMAFNDEIPYSESPSEGLMAKIVTPIDQIMNRLAGNSIFDHIYGLGHLYYYITKFRGTEADKIRVELKKYYNDHLSTLDKENPRDILDHLIIGGFDEERVINVSLDLLVAGGETSATTMEWFTIVMVNNPECQEKAADELRKVVGKDNGLVTVSHRQSTPYTNALLRELFRYKTVGPLGPLPRVAREDAVIQDYFIPKGTIILSNIYAIHNDEKHYQSPRQFIPERFLTDQHYEHWLPFSIGARNCLGLSIAVDEIYVLCSNLLLNFKISSANGQKLDETESMK